ncbi:proton-conducting transporter membrane subunit [Novosphingobium sp.]|uniref:proton-conducting transporter transmembrane domain-containing protein n=1 Tax=Novosphingobium sp. TaxID=1874826 RepID=UPI0038B8B658|nr:hypothetical protein [Pseudomonadota bacterium]
MASTYSPSGFATAPAPSAATSLAPRAALAVMAIALVAAGADGLVTATPAGLALAGLSILLTPLVLVFARRHLRADPRRAAHGRLATALAAATVLLALADNVLLLAAGWIAAGRVMTALVGHAADWAEARAAARRVTRAALIADLALVGALGTLAFAAKSATIGGILAAVPALPPAAVLAAAGLLVLAAVARCAAPPFSGWLLSSVAAPTPVSALMHAGFVNAGGFLLIRFAPVLEAAPAARALLLAIGIGGALWGSALMLVRSDVKGALAASTVAQMGFMLLTCALGAYAAALWHMVAHGLFKAWLFLGSAGTIGRPRQAKALPQAVPALIALAVLIIAALAMEAGIAETALLPLGLALAALLSALLVAASSLRRDHVRLVLIAVPALLIALNVGALALIGAVQPDTTAPLLSPPWQIALLSLFLAGWVVQQDLAAGRRALPPALHARLLHAGAPATSSRKD